MKTSGQINETDSQIAVPVDPFAVDFFGGATGELTEDGAGGGNAIGDRESDAGRIVRSHRRRVSEWYRALPRLSNAEAGFSGSLSAFPADIAESATAVVGASLARFVPSAGTAPTVRVASVAEVALSDAAGFREGVAIGLLAAGEPAVAVVETALARALVQTLLGVADDGRQTIGPLTPVETAVLEFVAADCINGINKLQDAARVTLTGVGGDRRTQVFAAHSRGAAIVAEVGTGAISGSVAVFASAGFARALSGTVFQRRPASTLSSAERAARGGPRLYLQAGATSLDAASLAYAEPGDIVLIDRPASGAQRSVVVGRGGLVLRGTPGADGTFAVAEIISEEHRRKFTPAKFAMEEFVTERDIEIDPADAADSAAVEGAPAVDAAERLSPALENIQVALRVEIAGNRIGLRELQELRPGQVIGLGCSPNDPVRLVTDASDEPVATGELVEIEGQLGVRLTKVFV